MTPQLERIAWQDALAAPRLHRAELAGLVPSWPCRRVQVHVLRNAAFELVAAALPPFLAYAGLEAAITYGPYDDSLSDPGAGMPERCDAVVVWLDTGRHDGSLSADDLAELVAGRVAELRRDCDAPVLVADCAGGPARPGYEVALASRLAALPGVHVCDVSALAAGLGEAWTDARLQSLSGSALSARACLETARAFGLGWLPAVLVPPVKAVVVDLDHTLYRGVLGEDGVTGLEVAEEHAALHRLLLELRARGVYLAIASKNEPADVERLFASRPDLALRPEHVSAWAIGWSSKADGLVRIAETLQVGTDAVVLVDDNAAELAEVAARLPDVGLVQARHPALTAELLRRYPGLFSFGSSATAARRSDDVAAAEQRRLALEAAPDPVAYLASLGMRLQLVTDDLADVQRLAELSGRTNQFNTGLLRLNEAQAAAYVSEPGRSAVTVALRDRFSDSGVIAALFAREEGGAVVVDELDVSCRALGRKLEPVIVAEAVARAVSSLRAQGRIPAAHSAAVAPDGGPAPGGARGDPARHAGGDRAVTVRFAFRSGPRNEPARSCLEQLTGRTVAADGEVEWEIGPATLAALRCTVPVQVEDAPPRRVGRSDRRSPRHD